MITTDPEKETKTAPQAQPPPAVVKVEKIPEEKPFLHRRGVIFVLMLIVIAGILFAATVILHALTHENTDDAFIDGHVISIAPKVAGKILAVYVKDNQEVKKGDLLFEIDPADYEASVTQKKAAVEVAIAKQKSAEASVQQAQTHMETIAAGLASLQASADATHLSTLLSHSDLARSKDLIKTGVVSAQDYEHAKSASETADANLESKVKEVDSAKAYVEEAKAAAESSAAQARAAQADVGEEQATLAGAELQLSYTKVTAPEDGHVTNKAVEPGDYVQTGQNLLALVPHEVWVTANFKETQITYMRPGEAVSVSVDAYPDRKLQAHVDSIQAGSGARFSLLPPENATGNFVKVVQRVPVKIVFDEKTEVQQALGPGMSAVPDVTVKDSAGPALIVTVIACIAILAVVVAALFWLKKTSNAQ